MAKSTIFLVVVLVMLATTMVALASDASVNIWNEIGPNEILTVDCDSKDRHLGVQQIKFNQYFGFGFTPNIWKTTLYTCGFKWAGRDVGLQVWKEEPQFFCLHCEYHVKADGIYRNEQGKPATKIQAW